MSRSILEEDCHKTTIPLRYDTAKDEAAHIYDFIEGDSLYTEMKPIPKEKIYTEVEPEYYNCSTVNKDASFIGIQVIDCPAYGTSIDCKVEKASSLDGQYY